MWKYCWKGFIWIVTPYNFIHRLRSENHLNVSIADSGSKRVKGGASFCYFASRSEIFGFFSWGVWLPIERYLYTINDSVGKADFRKGYKNQKQKNGITTYFQNLKLRFAIIERIRTRPKHLLVINIMGWQQLRKTDDVFSSCSDQF